MLEMSVSGGNSSRNLNVESMEKRFSRIAESIKDLTKHAMVRSVNLVNDDLIKAIGELDSLERVNGNSRLIKAYREKISDLEKEKVHSASIRDKWFGVKDMNGSVGDSSIVELTEEGGGDSAMSVIKDDDLHCGVRGREWLTGIRARRSPD